MGVCFSTPQGIPQISTGLFAYGADAMTNTISVSFSTPQGIPQISTQYAWQPPPANPGASVPRRAFLRFRPVGRFCMPSFTGDLASVPRRAFLRFRRAGEGDGYLAGSGSDPCFSTPQGIPQISTTTNDIQRELHASNGLASVPRRAFLRFRPGPRYLRMAARVLQAGTLSFSTPQGIPQISTHALQRGRWRTRQRVCRMQSFSTPQGIPQISTVHHHRRSKDVSCFSTPQGIPQISTSVLKTCGLPASFSVPRFSTPQGIPQISTCPVRES